TFWMIAPYVLAVVVGGILSLLCRPSLNFWIRRGVWPKIAAVMVTIGMVLLVIIPIGFLSSMAVKQGIVISRSIADTESYSLHEITSRISQTSLAAALDISAEDIHGYFSGLLKNAGRFGTDLLVGLVSQLPNGALQIVLTVLS